MKLVYVLVDWDDHESVHVFSQRRNAIQYAYEHCEAFGAYLSVNKWNPSERKWQYLHLPDVIGDSDPIDYLNTLNNEYVNNVFYEYYFLIEAEIEDMV